VHQEDFPFNILMTLLRLFRDAVVSGIVEAVLFQLLNHGLVEVVCVLVSNLYIFGACGWCLGPIGFLSSGTFDRFNVLGENNVFVKVRFRNSVGNDMSVVSVEEVDTVSKMVLSPLALQTCVEVLVGLDNHSVKVGFYEFQCPVSVLSTFSLAILHIFCTMKTTKEINDLHFLEATSTFIG